MFKQRRLNRLARKITEAEQEKDWHYHEFKAANASNDVEKTSEAWRDLTKICRRLSSLRRSHRKLEVKIK